MEDDVVVPSAVAEKTRNEKYRYHTARKGTMYYKNILTFQRGYKRRRTAGGGTTHKAILLRERLMEWWSIIRHSVDTKIMVRLPKAVFFDKGEAITVRIPRRVFETQCHSRACGRESPLAKSPLGHLQNLKQEAEQEVQSDTHNPDATARDLLDRDSEVAHHGDAAFRI